MLFGPECLQLEAAKTARRAPVSKIAQAYVEGLLLDQVGTVLRPALDLGRESLVLQYAEIRNQRDFVRLQAMGDWILWSSLVFKQRSQLRESLGRASYYRAYRLVPSFRVLEELGDLLPQVLSFCGQD